MQEFTDKISELKEIVDKIKSISSKYQETIEQANIPEKDIDKYITPNNQKSLLFLQTLDEDKLLDILEKGFLTGI